ncbi:PE-PPE domain-containing protein [[Mycobacterium] wendilense]|uniref:PE-PPE domain-containing protein n=1 Tax=[Mycobacterium] wendilense TaxID=3064284 RepID=A0ABM9MGB6_9MYCO|nr:PE-PPE domain-containing protein [Mycolicibacterium sp. MU0050]CAJ1584413.1 PE-PPE domain-containing protein [Mycolicibacterium sp. MU0050]
MNSAPTPPKLRKAKAAAVTAGAIGVTAALTFGGAGLAAEAVLADRNEVTVSNQLSQEEIDLLASIGIYPTGPLFQVARLAGLGNPDAALNSLENLANLLGQAELAGVIGTIRGVLDTLPFPIDARVPGFGPAGIIDAAASLDGGLGETQLLLSALKTVLLNAENLDALAPILAGLGIDLPAEVLPYLDLVADLPLNVPGTSAEVESGLLNDLLGFLIPGFPGLEVGAFLSEADKLAVIPAWGLGGTNFALASPTFLKDAAFKDTAILGILIRNTSRPGGGIVAMLNPLSQLVGLNLANVDGRGNPVEETIDISIDLPLLPDIDLAEVTITEYDGNVTVWDITAAYDLLSDAPSTIWNPVAWANSGVGFVMPTYLIPSTITQILDGDILGGLLDSLGMLKINVSETDGNLYITYDSGNLPLLEPVQFLPRTLSYFPGFDISTPVSSSFEQALRTLVATGYQDVQVTDTDGDGVYSFVRDFKSAGNQAYFWENPINFTQGLEVPQTLLNEFVDGLNANLLNPEGNSLELFGNNTLTQLLYDNGLAVPLAKIIRDGLNQVMAVLNPIINDVQEPLKQVTKLLDDAQAEVNKVIRDGLKAGAANPIVDLEGPMLDVNRFVNDLTEPLDNGIGNAVGNAVNEGETSNALMAKSSGPEIAADVPAAATSQPPALEVEDPKQSQENVFQEAVDKQGLDVSKDLLSDGEKEQGAKSVANSLKKQREALRDATDERLSKTQNSLRKASERNAKVAENLRKGDLGGAAKQVGDNVQNRVERLGKDINNGVKKLTGQDKKDDKKDSTSSSDNAA